jgi:hypothetical protein
MILTIAKVFNGDYGWPIFAVGLILFIITIVLTNRRKYLLVHNIHVKSTNLLGVLDSGQSPISQNNNYANDLQNYKSDIISGTSSEKV